MESKIKDLQLFCFSTIFEHSFDSTQQLNKIKEHLDSNLEEDEKWCKYWCTEGEEIVLQMWNAKYQDYLKQEGPNENINSQRSFVELNESEIDVDKNIEEQHTDEHHNAWNELWEQHRYNIYSDLFYKYTELFENYYSHLKDSLQNSLPTEVQLEEESEEPIDDYTTLSEELEQLKLLGLPTSFGGRPQYSGKKSKFQPLHFGNIFFESESEDMSSESENEDNSEGHILLSPKNDDSTLHGIHNKSIAKSSKKQKKRNRKLKNVPNFMLEEKGLLKYWRKRFSLFSRFDDGIRLDRESWFSVTPEKVAKHIAERLQCSIIVDGFCGSGGNAIQFALTCDKVIAIDIDPVKLELARHNATIYNVLHKIDFILGDFLTLASSEKLKADIVFLSPPWGGPQYKRKQNYDIEKYLLPVKASQLVEVATHVSKNVALFLPRNSNIKQVVQLAGVGKRCEIEHNYLDSRLVAITALYGEDILQNKTCNDLAVKT